MDFLIDKMMIDSGYRTRLLQSILNIEHYNQAYLDILGPLSQDELDTVLCNNVYHRSESWIVKHILDLGANPEREVAPLTNFDTNPTREGKLYHTIFDEFINYAHPENLELVLKKGVKIDPKAYSISEELMSGYGPDYLKKIKILFKYHDPRDLISCFRGESGRTSRPEVEQLFSKYT